MVYQSLIQQILTALSNVNTSSGPAGSADSRTTATQYSELLNELGLAVRTVPSYSDLAKGRMSVNDIRELSIDDVLGRDEVTTNQKLISKDIEGQVVLVVAGGSIGSELCLQVYSLKPKQLILFDLICTLQCL